MQSSKIRKYTFYAIGEIMLVVVGILIALQVNNWNQNRVEKKQESSILLDLSNDLINLKIRLDNWSEFNKRGEMLVMKVLGYPNDEIDKRVIDSLFSSMLFVNVLDKGGGPLEALISSGRLELVRNKEIREKLARWPDKLEDIHTNDLSMREIVWREILPYMAEFGIPEFICHPVEIYCTKEGPISDRYRNILIDDKFKALLRTRKIGFEMAAMDHAEKAGEAEELLSLIDKYLE